MVAGDHLPTGLQDVYFLVTPNGLRQLRGRRARTTARSAAAPTAATAAITRSRRPTAIVLYAVIPYNAVAGHCQSEQPAPERQHRRPDDLDDQPRAQRDGHRPVRQRAGSTAPATRTADLCIRRLRPPISAASGDERLERGDRRRPLLPPGASGATADGGCRPRAQARLAVVLRAANARTGQRVTFSRARLVGARSDQRLPRGSSAYGPRQRASVTIAFDAAGRHTGAARARHRPLG